MALLRRFGRKLAIPSTRQILHEFHVFSAQEDARLSALKTKRLAEAPEVLPSSGAAPD
ncbi:hypothetical protein [Lichenifustis flavocetrariae]|uniref:Uncharacterized protein n=1 Tax=Lichenifustis flavocetrariae TaxID=2949735 RepID=A0AA42CJ20_9HYPH|nr:hypothetical protein [Lichenifustis flavocetrariae]MCW6508974.1 hypothetical protein [Lichenifustis flavocetrariae]